MPINRIPKVKSVSGKIGDVILTSSDVGLGNVNNTSDLNKPIPTAVQTALNAKQDVLSAGSGISITNGTISYNGTTGVTIDQVNTAIDTKLSGLNLFPTANPDTANGTENTYISGNVLTNDTTKTGSLYVTQYKVYTLSQPAGVVYTAGVPSTTSPLGTFLMNADGSWTLTPKLYSYGAYTVNYWVSNGVSNPVMGTLTINLAFVNQAPVTAPDSASGVENTPITITPLANDYDPEGSVLSIVALNGTSVVAGQSVNVTNASVLLNSDKSITITPATNFIGTVQFTYTASDGSLTTLGNVSATFTAPQTGGGTSNYVTGTTTTIPYNFVGNIPLKNVSVVEPTTGATIKRLTDVTQDAPGFLALYNAYSRYPNENVTGEYVLAFGYNSTTCYVMNRSTGTVVASLAYDNTGLSTHTIGAYHEIRWHYGSNHPYRVYFVLNQQLWMIDDIRSQNTTRTLVKDFSTLIDWTGVTSTNRRIYCDQEGNSSHDSDHWAWMAAAYDGSNWVVRAYIHYQISTDTMHTMYPADMANITRAPSGENTLTTFRYKPNMVEMAPDASGIVIHSNMAYSGFEDQYIGTVFEAPYLWPVDFKQTTFAPFRIASDSTHSGWSSVNGAWYFTCQDNRRDKWMAVPISGPNKGYGNEGKLDVTLALSPGVIDFHTDGDIYPGMHFGVCTNAADGWTLVTTYSTSDLTTKPLSNTVWLMQVKPEAQTIKWMVSPSCNQYQAAGKQDYDEAPASINLAGTRILTCGNFGNATGTYVDPQTGITKHYVDMWEIALPTNWQNHFVPAAPVNNTIPSFTGTATQNQTLNYVAGAWSGFPTPTITHNWQRDSVDIAGATGTTYTLTSADVGHSIRVREQAVNASGTVNAYSNASASVASVPVPGNLTLPTTSGVYQQGTVMNITNGTWSNSPTSVTNDILRDGTTVVATNVGNTYTIAAGDVGHTLVVRENATNSYGTVSALSAATPTIVLNQGTITRISSVISVDPSGSFESSRTSNTFDSIAGNLLVVNITFQDTGSNTIKSVTDLAGNTYTAGANAVTVGATQNVITQQWWCLSSLAKTGNAVTVTQSGGTNGMSGLLDVSVQQYHTTTGSWTKTTGVTGGTDYVALPLITSSFNMNANSVAVESVASYYTNTLPISSYGDTIAATQQNSGWIIERISGTALSNQTMSSMDSQGGGYSRLCYSVSVFTAA